ncbi:hypothetical protein FNV43_RR02300 [Rhamnella rubrinervis]|uniref:Chromosome transmission fidelity protein 18 homolog n=1 Tax=Rhamnella rubrinervis TaxID=2594499 RepID=A0A8K0MT40_9ROSA|nr:hypothetical protein FNV43_RR02300 [Rhamnella rubrinervis]
MDMDIPLPEELEFLEANYNAHEDYLDLEPPEPYPDEDLQVEEEAGQSKSPSSEGPPSSPGVLTNIQKRSRSTDGPDASILEDAGQSDEKRSRTVQAEVAQADEDWLRYSPPEESDPMVEEGAGAVVEEKLVWRYASEIDGDFIPVTAPSGGDRAYVKINVVDKEERRKKLGVIVQSGGLILEPINVLLQKVEQEAFTKALKASSGGQSDTILPETPAVHEQLWVDKYAPSTFTELLSDEQTNREVLLWLKQWDSCVFGSEVKSTPADVLSALRRHSSTVQHRKFSDSKFPSKNRGSRWNKEDFSHSSDVDDKDTSKGIQDLWNKKSRSTGPPEQKILLLCGPPGLGKTTLAHVAAKHCGYRVVEVNASDDRSSSVIEAKILDVVQMNSVTVDSRPKCLVIDEIDGALGDGKGAVEVILKMVSADRKSDLGKENVSKEENRQRTSTKKGRKIAPLLRPVICICNDLYAPALRPLRQIAKVHIFVQPTVSRVVSRLKHICNKEQMKTSSIALTGLAEYTECDIRSCLNTLQFLNKKKETLNVLEIGSQVVGRKDMSRSAFDIWKEIFQKRNIKRERRSNCRTQSTPSEFEFLHSLISNRGDYDLIVDGIHENILQLHYHDPLMQKTVKCLSSLGVSDLLHQHIMRTQQMPLLVYQPAIAIIVHRLVAQVQKPNIEWPKSYYRFRTMLMEKTETLRSWYYKIPPHISRHLSTKSFVEESISPLLHILSPSTLRPVAVNLLSDKEKNDLFQLISTMVSYSLTYRNIKTNSQPGDPRHEATLDASVLAFDPPINDFINFKGYKSCHYVLALAMKQVLVHEVEKQRILRVNTGRSGNLTDACNKENQVHLGEDTSGSQAAKAGNACAIAKNTEKPTSLSILRQSKPTKPTISSDLGSNTNAATASLNSKSSRNMKRSNGSSSFFDRFRKMNTKGSQNANNVVQEEETLARDLRPLLFKFNELGACEDKPAFDVVMVFYIMVHLKTIYSFEIIM